MVDTWDKTDPKDERNWTGPEIAFLGMLPGAKFEFEPAGPIEDVWIGEGLTPDFEEDPEPKTEWQLLAEMQARYLEIMKGACVFDPDFDLIVDFGQKFVYGLTPERVRETYEAWQKVKG